MDSILDNLSSSIVEDLFNEINIGILFLDKNRNILLANNEISNTLGYTREELIGMNGEELSLKEDDNDSKQKIQEAISNKKLNIELVKRYIHKDGSIVYCELSVGLTSKSDVFVVFVKDVTERIQQHRKLENLSNKLKESNTAKDKLFSIISHDLINPIGSIKNLSGVLSENFHTYDEEKKHKIIKTIFNASNRSFKLLDNLLIWAQAQSNKLVINTEAIDLRNIIVEQIKLYHNLIEEKQITIKEELDHGVIVVADYNTISVVIRNLISNAVKFTPMGGEISISTEALNKETTVVSISDSGIGIPEDKLDNLFSIHNEYTSYGTNDEKGTGLGLRLCNDFIKMNNGTINVISKVGIGSTFSFTLKNYIE